MILKSIYIMFSLFTLKELIRFIKQTRERRKKKLELKNLEIRKKYYYKDVLNKTGLRDLIHINIDDVPHLSFKQWLSFYNISSDKWIIDLNQAYYDRKYFCAMPVYTNDTNDIVTFWETQDDLWSFIEWQDNVYREELSKKEEKISKENQEKALIELTKNLKKDLEEKNKQVQNELDKLEKQIAESMPMPAPKGNPMLVSAQGGRSNAHLVTWEEKVESLVDTLNHEYPEYYYKLIKQSTTSAGYKVVDIVLDYQYGDIKLQKTYIYDDIKCKWEPTEKNYIYDNRDHEWK